jgi:TolA-binding protein
MEKRMSPKSFLFRLLVIFLVASPLVLNGCSYIPWIGDSEEEDLAFEEDFPFEDEEPTVSAGGSDGGDDDFFAEDGALAEGGGGDFSSIDQGTDSKELKGDVESLQYQQEALVSKVRELEEILSTLEPKLSATQERLEGSLSSVASQSEFLQPEVEELKLKVNQLHEEISRLKMGGVKVPSSGGGTSHRASSRSSKTPSEYNKALDAYRAGNYDESILLFQNFALSNPPLQLKDNILFWIGSNYVKLEMYDNAIKQFDTVINQFPRGNKAHDSRLMLGISYYKKGEASRAIEVLQSALKYNPPSEVKGKILAQLDAIQ